MGFPLVQRARTNEKSAVNSATTASLVRVLFMEYNMTIDAIGRVEAIVVATILEIRSSPAWE